MTLKRLVDLAGPKSGMTEDDLLAMLDSGRAAAFVLMDTQRTARWSCRIPDASKHPANEERFDGINFEIVIGPDGMPVERLNKLSIGGVVFVRVYLDRGSLPHMPSRGADQSWRSLLRSGTSLHPRRMAAVLQPPKKPRVSGVTESFRFWKRSAGRARLDCVFEAGLGNPIRLNDVYMDRSAVPRR